MTLKIGAFRLRLHPLLPMLWLFCLLTGAEERLLTMLLALALHEAGHLIAARALQAEPEELEITPLGGLLTLRHFSETPPLRRFLLAAAGPGASLLGCLAAPLLYRWGIGSFAWIGCWIHANLALLLVNLLPALPLDGGQMLRALLSRKLPEAGVTKALTLCSSIVGAALCALTFAFAVQGKLLLSPAFAGLYLLYAAAVEGRQSTARYVTSLIARRQRLEKEAVLPVEMVAAGERTPVRSLLRQFSSGKYHLIQVLSPDGMTRQGVIEEKAFCEAVLKKPDQTLAEVLRGTQEKSLPALQEGAKGD